MPLYIVRNDITNMKVDAIVNTANPHAQVGAGVDFAIYQKAGMEQLLHERKKIGDIAVGEAAVTPAFRLQAKYIIHTVGPSWVDGLHGEEKAIITCYQNSFYQALRLRCESIAFPLIATGTYRFPKERALQIALSVIRDFLKGNEMVVYLVVYDQKSFELSKDLDETVQSYINARYVESKQLQQSQLNASQRIHCERRVETETEGQQMSAGKSKKSGQAFGFSLFTNRSLDEVLQEMSETFQQSLLRLIDQKEKMDVEVYKKANLDRKLFSKIRGNVNYQPSKKTALAFAIALELNLDETKDLLAKAGFAFSPCSKFDVIIEYFISNGIYDIYTINLTLFEYGQMQLGA